MSDTMAMHDAFVEAFTARVTDDPRLRAAWLEGSLGRGSGDRYSDVDLHLLLDADECDAFKAGAEAWLSAVSPLVLFTLLFDGKMINALTEDGLRVDIWLHTGDTAPVDGSLSRVLVNKGGSVQSVTREATPIEPAALQRRLAQQIREFWRCIAMVPAVVGRQELIVGCMGLTVETGLLTEVLLLGHGIQRDRGVKRLNAFLPDVMRREIEEALAMEGLSPQSLASGHLALARLMQRYGRGVAERHRFPYPDSLEAAVMRYVQTELARLA